MTTTRKANGVQHHAATADAGYLFRVPADKKGRRFIAQLRQHINRHDIERVRVLCNGPRRAAMEKARTEPGADPQRGFWTYNSYLPQRFATEFRVYVDTKSRHEQWRKAYDAAREIERLTLALRRAHGEMAAISEQHRMAATSRDNIAERLMTLSESAKRLADENVRLRAKYMHVPDWLARLCHALGRKVR